MAKLSKIEQARFDGFNRACEIARKDGVEALLAEQKRRGCTGISVALDSESQRHIAEHIGGNAIWLAVNVMCLVLRDQFGFGRKRIQKALTEYAEVTDSIDLNLLNYEDINTVIKQETGVDFSAFVPRSGIQLK